MCALFSQFWAFRQKQRGILSEVVRLHEADEIKVRNAKTLRRHCEDLKDSIRFVTCMTLRANCMSTKLRHATLACLSAFVSPVASTFECSSLVNFCSTVPGLPVSFAELNCERSQICSGRQKRHWAGETSSGGPNQDCTGDAASFSEHEELVLKKKNISKIYYIIYI